MMKLINYDEIVVIGGNCFGQRTGIERLYRYEQVVKRFGLVLANEQLAEIRVVKHSAKALYALLQNFLTVCYKKQAAAFDGVFIPKAAVVER